MVRPVARRREWWRAKSSIICHGLVVMNVRFDDDELRWREPHDVCVYMSLSLSCPLYMYVSLSRFLYIYCMFLVSHVYFFVSPCISIRMVLSLFLRLIGMTTSDICELLITYCYAFRSVPSNLALSVCLCLSICLSVSLSLSLSLNSCTHFCGPYLNADTNFNANRSIQNVAGHKF